MRPATPRYLQVAGRQSGARTMSGPELIIFADQPRVGESMAGLIPRFTPEEAAAVASVLMRATVDLALASWPGAVSLYAWPDAAHEVFISLARDRGLFLGVQEGPDCAARIRAALTEAVARCGAAAILRADVPHCQWQAIDQANEWLAQGYNVLGPTEGGDCYFFGVREVEPRLIEDIPWGTPRLVAALGHRAEELGIELELLPALHTIETPHDLWLISQTCDALRPLVK
jgi:glycosyltransferase A (GT-A) superfamily protein (DUF2064 family)